MSRKRQNAGSENNVAAKPEEIITEEEQLRIIQESGILKIATENQATISPIVGRKDEPSKATLIDELLDTVILLIPFSFLYVGMDIMVKQQYAQHPNFREELEQYLSAIPILALFIFYSNRYKPKLLLQIAMSLASVASGCRLVYIINKSPFGIVIQQAPPLGVIWVYTIVQLHLAYACLALAAVFVYVRAYGMKIVF
ncbi:hypothetical protein FRC15_007686 [Serendipita sp. 397]|nr:hypothetical protein FRC15_007686 [Serendipita sp. 397]